jgi:hypothetical protein
MRTMTDVIDAIAEEIDDRAESLEGVERSSDGTSTSYARAGRVFALADERGFEFLVGDVIAGAALRTPDVSPGLGGGWVRFAPAELDQPALDRAIAWFEAAWRRAEGGRAEE